ncbi:MAG: mechanosensitive ion channel family protein [Spirochaetes bacterium]|jgi:small-conductance mechanosensitive channel|nr:mechanosensitive ion channel family protein [Spirochaetota bacterium]
MIPFNITVLSWIPWWGQLLLLTFTAELTFIIISYATPLFVKKEKVIAFRIFLKSIRPPALLFIAVFIFNWGIRKALPDSFIIPLVARIVPLLLIFAVALLILRFSSALFKFLLNQFNISQKDNLRARKATTQINLLQRVITFLVILISFGAALMTIPSVRAYGTSILASAGIAGIAIGFAAQQTLANVLAGIQVAVTQPLRYDDAVVIDGEWGWVEEITLTYIVVRLWDRRRLVTPISKLLQNSFQNWTRMTSSIIGSVFFYLDYKTDVDALRKEQTRILQDCAFWDGDVNVIQVTDTTEHSIVVRSLISGKDSPTTWDLRCFVREQLIAYLKKTQPTSLPRQRIHIENKLKEREE